MLYILKRKFGQQITYSRHTDSTNYKTGAVTRSTDSQTIKRAIVSNSKVVKMTDYGSQDFSYGGVFTSDMRTIIIDQSDFSSDFVPQNDDEITFDDKIWNIKSMSRLEDNRGWIFVVKNTADKS